MFRWTAILDYTILSDSGQINDCSSTYEIDEIEELQEIVEYLDGNSWSNLEGDIKIHLAYNHRGK